MDIGNVFKIGEIVFLVTDTDQCQRMITGFVVRKDSIIYYLTCGTLETCHYDFEIASNKNFKI